MKKRNGIYHKVVALLLAMLCVVGLLPTAASAAADDTIKLKKFGASEVAYESAVLGSCTLHEMYFDTGSPSTTIGFCGTKGNGMGSSLQGQTWGNPKPVTDKYIKMMVAFYYAHSTGTFTDAARAVGEDYVWDAGYTWYMDAWVQAIIWRWKEGSFSDPVVACAEELMAVYNKLDGGKYTSIDDVQNNASFRQQAKYILDLGEKGVWGDCKVYEYDFTGAGSAQHPASGVQKVIIGKLIPTEVTEDHYKCESRVEKKRSEGGGEATEEMKKQARERTNHRSGLNIGQTI